MAKSKSSRYARAATPEQEAPETNASPEPTPAEIAAIQPLQPVQMPEWYASGAQLVFAGNDVQLVFNKPVVSQFEIFCLIAISRFRTAISKAF